MWHLTDPLRPVLGRFYAAVGSDLMLRLARRRLLLGEGSPPGRADPELPAFDPDRGEEAPEQGQPSGPVFPIRASPQRFFSRSGSAAHSTRGQSTAGALVPRASSAPILAALSAAALRAAGATSRDSPLHPPATAPAGASAPTMAEGASGGSQETVAAPAASRGRAAAGLAPAETVHRSQGAIPAPTGGQALPGLTSADTVRHSQELLAAPRTTAGEAAPGLMPGDPAHHGPPASPPRIRSHAPTTATAPLAARAEQAPLLRLTWAAAQRWHRRTTLQAMAGSMLTTGELVVPSGSAGPPVMPRGPTVRGGPVAAPGAPPAEQRALSAPAFTSHPRWSGAPEPAVTGGPGAAALRLPDALFPPLPAAALPFDAVAVGDEFLFEERVRRVLGRILRTDALRHGLTLGER